MRWLLLGPRCASRIYQSPYPKVQTARCDCSSITAENLVAERTRAVSRLRWHLHELDPEIDPTPRSLDRISSYDKLEQRIACFDGLVAPGPQRTGTLPRPPPGRGARNP